METYPQNLAQMTLALKDREAPTLARLAHTIKGSAGIFHADSIINAAAHLENAAQVEDFQAAQAAFELLTAELEKLESKFKDQAVVT